MKRAMVGVFPAVVLIERIERRDLNVVLAGGGHRGCPPPAPSDRVSRSQPTPQQGGSKQLMRSSLICLRAAGWAGWV